MKRIDISQGNIDKADCVNIAISSLTHIPYKQVPRVNLFGDKWLEALKLFLLSRNYIMSDGLYNPVYFLEKVEGAGSKEYIEFNKLIFCFNENSLLRKKGVKGYFYAVTKGFDDGKLHAVVIDRNFNIVNTGADSHYDPLNMPGKDKYGYNGVLYVYFIEKIRKSNKS